MISNFNLIDKEKNDFVIIVEDINQKLKYEIPNADNITILEKNYENSIYLKNMILKYDAVVFHPIDNFKFSLIKSIPKNKKIVWMVWGSEYTLGMDDINDYYSPKTQEYFVKIKKISFLNKSKIGKLIKIIILRLLYMTKKSSYKRITHCCTISEYEYKKLIKHLGIKPKYIDFNYGSNVNLYLNDNIEKIADINLNLISNIILGNSGFPSNNHFEIMDLLNQMDLGKRNIIVPLNYGDTEYIIEVNKYGEKMLKENFDPITNWMNIYDFTILLKSCSHIIINSFQQHAAANIMIALWYGLDLFLSSKSDFAYYLKNSGFQFQMIESCLSQETLSKRFTTPEILMNNRKLLVARNGKDSIFRKYKNFIKTLS
jgi:hypothetical protein